MPSARLIRRFRNPASILVILAEDTVGRLEARTALPPPEADAQQRAAAAEAVAEPDAQQGGAAGAGAGAAQAAGGGGGGGGAGAGAGGGGGAGAGRGARQGGGGGVGEMRWEARPPVPLAEFAETAVVRSWIQATWFLVRAPERPMVVAAEEQAAAVRLWFRGQSASALGQELPAKALATAYPPRRACRLRAAPVVRPPQA